MTFVKLFAIRTLGALVAAACATFILILVDTPPGATLFVVVVLAVSTCAILIDSRFRETQLPVLLRPTLVCTGAALVAATGAAALNDPDKSIYAGLKVVELASLLAGSAMATIRVARNSDTNLEKNYFKRESDRRGNIAKLAIIVFAFSNIAVLVFFSIKGIPVLMADVEQSRVDAATSGTGYFRLVAYFSIPSTVVLVAIRHPMRNVFLLITILIVIGLGNRSPLVYLGLGLVAIRLHPVNEKKKLGTARIALAILAGLVVIVGFGVYRIESTHEFRKYDEYREAIDTGNHFSIARTALLHYVDVVAENAVLSKHLVDIGRLEKEFGLSYALPVYTALPGQQLSMDLKIKKATGKTFVGGGTPPTLSGEGYINFGWPGVVGGAVLLGMVLGRGANVAFLSSERSGVDLIALRCRAGLYGYLMAYGIMAQVSGFVGASTMPLTALIVLIVISHKLRIADVGKNSLAGN